MNQIPLSIYLLGLLVILFAGCKMAKKKTLHEDFLDYPIAKALQGFAALAIILHHVTQDVTQYGAHNKGIIGILNDTGVLFTGMFFFFSGYGLIISLLNKKDYMKGFLKKRLATVMIPFYVCNLLFVGVSYATGYKATSQEWMTYASGGILMNDQMWFIIELAILYFAFFLIFKKGKSGIKQFAIMAIFITVMTTMSLLSGHDSLQGTLGLWFHGEWWYNTTWLFFVGMLVAKHKDSIFAFAKKSYVWLLPVSIVVTVVLYFATMYMLGTMGYWKESATYPGYLEKFLTMLVQCSFVIVFVLTFVLITMKVQFKNKVLSFMGTIALETYLIQNIFIVNFTNMKNDLLFFAAVYAGTIVAAVIVHGVNKKLIGWVK